MVNGELVKITVTTDVNHRVNRAYPCVLVEWEPSDTNYFPNAHNWMPKHEEIERIIKALIRADPDHYLSLANFLPNFLPNGSGGAGNQAANGPQGRGGGSNPPSPTNQLSRGAVR